MLLPIAISSREPTVSSAIVVMAASSRGPSGKNSKGYGHQKKAWLRWRERQRKHKKRLNVEKQILRDYKIIMYERELALDNLVANLANLSVH